MKKCYESKLLKIKPLIFYFFLLFLSSSLLAQTNYYCDPVNGNMINEGSLESPWSSLANVFTEGKTFSAGDTIFLMTGDHGEPDITTQNDGYVVITPLQDENPVLVTLDLDGASYWKLIGLTINPEKLFPNQNVPLEHPVYPIDENTMLRIDGCSNLLIEGCSAYSYADITGWTKDDWNSKAWNGIRTSGTNNNVTITECHFKNVNFGGLLSGSSTNVFFENSTIENFCGDGIQTGSNYIVIQYNTIKNCYKVNGNHDDLLQVYRGSTVYGIKIIGNKLFNYSDPNQPLLGAAQGIGCFDGMLVDLIIENNLVVTDTYHGITLMGATDCYIVNNTVLDVNNSTPGPAWIMVAPHKDGRISTGNVIRNNICSTLDLNHENGEDDHNLVVGFNSYSNYFVDPANFDFRLKAGSPAIDAGSAEDAPDLDADRNSRPSINGYDLGALEYVGEFIRVETINVTPEQVTLNAGQTQDLTVELLPSDAINRAVNWESENDRIVKVSQSGVITALVPGTTNIYAISDDTGIADTSEVTVTDDGLAYNVSLFKPVKATETEVTTPEVNLTDNDPFDAARWSADGMPQTVEVDLGKDYDLSKINLYTYKKRAYQYVIEARSEDQEEYTEIVDRSENNDNTQPIEDNVDVTARFIKLTVTGASDYTGDWVSLNELEVYGRESETENIYLINEDFSVGAANFHPMSGGDWNVENDFYSLTSPATDTSRVLGNTSVHYKKVEGNYIVSSALNLPSESEGGIVVNYQDQENFYYVALNVTGNEETQGIFKVKDGIEDKLVDIDFEPISDSSYLIDIVKIDSAFYVLISDELIASAIDSTFSGGYVGFGSTNSPASYDFLLVNSDVSGFELDTVSSVDKYFLETNIDVYPNPVNSSQLYFKLDKTNSESSFYDIQIVDIIGRKVFRKELRLVGNERNIDVSNLKDGMYILSISSKNFIAQKKFLIKRE